MACSGELGLVSHCCIVVVFSGGRSSHWHFVVAHFSRGGCAFLPAVHSAHCWFVCCVQVMHCRCPFPVLPWTDTFGLRCHPGTPLYDMTFCALAAVVCDTIDIVVYTAVIIVLHFSGTDSVAVLECVFSAVPPIVWVDVLDILLLPPTFPNISYVTFYCTSVHICTCHTNPLPFSGLGFGLIFPTYSSIIHVLPNKPPTFSSPLRFSTILLP